jgi:hypothetical protein
MFATHVAGLAVTRSGCGHAQSAAAPVTVPHTRERQEALTAATTYGKKFFVTGGKHITSDNMFKSAKIVSQNAEAVEREKDGKRHLEYHSRREATLPVLDHLENELENVVARLTGKELEVLLHWKGIPVSKNGECGKQTGAVPTIRRWRRGGGGRHEHPRPMDGR